jgi:DNA-binding transcriptional ArsR family regulator
MTSATQSTRAVDERTLRALGHPLRMRILHELNSKVTSPGKLAREFDEPLPNVSYHIQVLLETGAIELVRTEPRRGALEHFYRATMRPEIDEATYSRLPESMREALATDALKTIWDEIWAAGEDHGFVDPQTHLSLTPLQLDEQALAELSEHLNETLEMAMRLQAESHERALDSGDEVESLTAHQLGILRFDRASAEAKKKVPKAKRRRGKGR